MRPSITAIVVSFNTPDELQRCLASLRASTGVGLKTIVVDNDSAFDVAAVVQRAYPDAELIRNSSNRGFAAAVNQGLARASETVVLINPDLTVQPDTLAILYDRLIAHPNAGIVGPKLRYPDGTHQPSVKRFPRWIDLALTLAKLPNFVPGLSRRYHATDTDYDREQMVDQVMGSCFMIRPQTLYAVGSFDEGFFIWFEGSIFAGEPGSAAG
ncbi:MAG: glycosyltransferase family 2 protein [Candidatus Kerfeldbacteria bacterium]|nr:glycosyltransferase family 2 protein [Candidatus Kerfeldbacteria bacterium]